MHFLLQDNKSWFQEPNPIHTSNSADTIFEEIPSTHSPDNVVLTEHFPSSQPSGSDMIFSDSSTDTLPTDTLPSHSTFDDTIINSKVVYSDIVKVKRVAFAESDDESEEEEEEEGSEGGSDVGNHSRKVKRWLASYAV